MHISEVEKYRAQKEDRMRAYRTPEAREEDRAALSESERHLKSLEHRRQNTEFLFGHNTASRDNSAFGYNPSQSEIDEARQSVKIKREDEAQFERDKG